MLEKLLNSRQQVVLNKAMDAASLRNEVIANNIANVDTPGFKRSEVLFQDKIKDLLTDKPSGYKLSRTDATHMKNKSDNYPLDCTNPKHLQIYQEPSDLDSIQPEIQTLEDLSYRNDKNNVDIDVEMANNTKNKIYYDSVSQSMSNEIKLLRMAIVGRG